MDWIVTLVVGGIVGWLASILMKTNAQMGIIANVVVGIIGSTKNGTAGPASDLDLLLHVEADGSRRGELALWLDGWSQSLAEANYLRTGYRTDGLLDVHYVTDDDIAGGTNPFAAKIGAVTDPARPLPLGPETPTALT